MDGTKEDNRDEGAQCGCAADKSQLHRYAMGCCAELLIQRVIR